MVKRINSFRFLVSGVWFILVSWLVCYFLFFSIGEIFIVFGCVLESLVFRSREYI